MISKPLEETWDGSATKFPLFMIALRSRAEDGKWNATDTSGIIDINGQDLLTNYHSIPKADIETTRVARTNERAK